MRGSDGTLYFIRAGEPDLRVQEPDALDLALVALLAEGEHTFGELAEALPGSPAALRGKLTALVEAGVALEHAGGRPRLTDTDQERFSRQLPYLAELGPPEALQHGLRSTEVLVIGTGGLGSWIVASLCAAGVGRLTLVDPDIVELSNLNRQILFGSASVGRPKVSETARWIEEFDDSIGVRCVPMKVEAPRQVEELLPGVDAVVLAADQPPHDLAAWVNGACMAAGVPFLTAGQHLPIIRVGPTYVPGRTACFECHARQLRRDSPLYDDYIEHARRGGRPDATLGCTSGIAGSMAATELLTLLTSGCGATAGAALILDVRTLATRREAVARDAGCAVCQHLPAWQPKATRPA